MKDGKIKRVLIVFFSVFLAYPLFEMLTPISISGMVHRANLEKTAEPFSLKSWFNGKFQDSFSQYLNDNIGLFPFFIKVHNQLEYDLFGNIYTGNVIAGKENFLFEKEYIDAYFGQDFIGIKKIEKNVALLKQLQDEMARRDKYLMVCLAAGKCSYYPEYIPYEADIDSTNYQYYTQEFERLGINYLDANPWFLKMKDSLGYLLYPQYGIHWSHYGAILATDSIARSIDHATSWNLPKMKILDRPYSDEAKYYDNDIAHSLNLFNPIQPSPMVYPNFEWGKKKSNKMRKLLIVGDSFTWDIFEYSRIGTDCFDEIQFWFYNQTVHQDAQRDGKEAKALPTLTRHLDFNEVMQEFDAFLILTNQPNLVNLGWNFTQDALGVLADSTLRPKERNNSYLQDQARSKKEWRDELQKQAKERGISLDSMINVYLHDPNYKP